MGEPRDAHRKIALIALLSVTLLLLCLGCSEKDNPVSDGSPSVEITSPTNGSTFEVGEDITFFGNAIDPEDGNLTGDSLVWMSSSDGVLGVGTYLTRDDLSEGEHSITLRATDRQGNRGEDNVGIAVGGVLIDGTLLLSTDWNAGQSDIYALSGATSVLTRLTTNLQQDERARWTPDGSHVVFHRRETGSQTGDVWMISNDGSAEQQLTHTGDICVPVLSPDGSHLAFAAERDRSMEIYVSDLDGSNATRITDIGRSAYVPDWSPDGQRIVFAATRSGEGYSSICVVDADGGNLTQLTHNEDDWGEWVPYWSPDGSKIVFTSYRDGFVQVYVMNADGSGQTRVTNTSSVAVATAWSPDGLYIAYVCYDDDPDGDAYIIPIDGGEATRLLSHEGLEVVCDWRQ